MQDAGSCRPERRGEDNRITMRDWPSPSMHSAIDLPGFCGGCIATATGIAFVLSIGIVPALVEKYGTLDNAYWQVQLAWAIVTLCLLSLTFILVFILLVSGKYLTWRSGWLVMSCALANFIAYTVQAHFDGGTKIVLLAVGVLLILCATIGWTSASRQRMARSAGSRLSRLGSPPV